MSYTAPYIDVTGPHVPIYEDVQEYIITQMQAIFGSDVYLGNDAQDYQMASIFAQAFMDCIGFGLQVYSSFSPSTAYGESLSRNVKLNGISREIPTNSQATLTLDGQAGTVITGAKARDANGYLWSIADTTIPLAGTINVTGTCDTEGNIQAPPGTITIKAQGVTRGWQTVTNAAAATPGNAVETDEELRLRQRDSVAIPGTSTIESITAGISVVAGVDQVVVYENDTDVTDANGIPSHSVAPVVIGGDTVEIANAIYLRLAPGIGTYGGVLNTIEDSAGILHTVKYSEPSYPAISVNITIQAGNGYKSAYADQVASALADYINGLGIGEDVSFGRLYTPANSVSETYSVESIEIDKDGGGFAAADIAIDWDEKAACDIADVTVTVT